MGLFENLIGNTNSRVTKEINSFLMPNEDVEKIYLINEDYMALTDKRILFVNRRFFSSKKNIISIPYNKITALNFTKAGLLSLSSEIEIFVGSVKYKFKIIKKTDAAEWFNLINYKIL